MEIQNPRLTFTLPGRLTDAFNSLPRLETVIMRNPTALHCFPHPSSVHCLKLLNIPPDCDDWEWVRNVDTLTELHISIREEQEDSGGQQIHKANRYSGASSRTASTLTKVMSHLPNTLIKLVVSVTRSGTSSGILTLDGDQAGLTNVNDDETSFAIAVVLGGLPEFMRTKVYIFILHYLLVRRAAIWAPFHKGLRFIASFLKANG